VVVTTGTSGKDAAAVYRFIQEGEIADITASVSV
jgi:hypothetical protein